MKPPLSRCRTGQQHRAHRRWSGDACPPLQNAMLMDTIHTARHELGPAAASVRASKAPCACDEVHRFESRHIRAAAEMRSMKDAGRVLVRIALEKRKGPRVPDTHVACAAALVDVQCYHEPPRRPPSSRGSWISGRHRHQHRLAGGPVKGRVFQVECDSDLRAPGRIARRRRQGRGWRWDVRYKSEDSRSAVSTIMSCTFLASDRNVFVLALNVLDACCSSPSDEGAT
ncbi:hypothetical protein C8Q76DRAFT_247453 [Earliella scabrosa]|nr:hypothetical protein C8Q76DRAFT_247453 [Earliella scabrosa]